MIRRIVPGLLVLLILASVPVVAAAQTAVGLRGGVSVDPDQAFFGIHFDTPPLIGRLTFRPNFEIGVGDDLTLAALNFELVYWVPVPRTAWRLYVGGGPALNIYSFDDDKTGHGNDDEFDPDDDTDVEGGFNLLFGLQHRRGFFTEVKVGTMESPDMKFTVGYVFGR